MPPPGSRTLSQWETQLDLLRDHSALGPTVRFYFRRREQLLYLVVGGWNTVFGYGVWALMQYVLGDYLHYLVIVVRSRGSVLREFPRFSLVYLATLVVNLALLPTALAVLPFNIYAIQALFTVVAIVVSFLSHKHYSFRSGQHRDDHDLAPYDPPAGSGD